MASILRRKRKEREAKGNGDATTRKNVTRDHVRLAATQGEEALESLAMMQLTTAHGDIVKAYNAIGALLFDGDDGRSKSEVLSTIIDDDGKTVVDIMVEAVKSTRTARKTGNHFVDRIWENPKYAKDLPDAPAPADDADDDDDDDDDEDLNEEEED